MEIRGKIHEVGITQQVSETFKKRDVVIEYAENPTYPEYIRFEALQDKTSLLDELCPGDEVTVSFNLRGRPWTDKQGKTSYFNSLVIWKLNINKTTSGQAAPQQAQQAAYQPPTFNPNDPGAEDDFPF